MRTLTSRRIIMGISLLAGAGCGSSGDADGVAVAGLDASIDFRLDLGEAANPGHDAFAPDDAADAAPLDATGGEASFGDATAGDGGSGDDATDGDGGGSDGDAGPTSITWSDTATPYRGLIGEHETLACPPNGGAYSLWGTDTYTDDSSICTAAVHAGLITLAAGGTVTIEITAGQSSYPGSLRHGVQSTAYPKAWSGSFVFYPLRVPNCGNLAQDGDEIAVDCGGSCPACAAFIDCTKAADCASGSCAPTTCSAVAAWGDKATALRGRDGERFSFQCPAGGGAYSVWGSTYFTDDSSVCTAGVFAGKITFAAGGLVVFEMAPGQASYVSATQNGVTTSSYGAFTGSFSIP